MNKRPINLALTTIHFPLPAIISILHRISGVIIFFAIPILLWMLQASLSSASGFYTLQHCMESVTMRFIVWGILSALLYHVVAGVRHLLMDAGFFGSLAAIRLSSKISLIIAIIMILIAGVWIW